MSLHTLRFGINGLDDLLSGSASKANKKTKGIDIPARPEGGAQATSLCIVGPDGTGKSVFALHLASYFAADAFTSGSKRPPKVFYASTDLRFSKAERIWHHFMLDFPLARPIPFSEQWFRGSVGTRVAQGRKLNVLLNDFPPISVQSDKNNLAEFLARRLTEPEVAFVDLAAHTSGDDWNFLDRLVSLLDQDAESQPHLLVIDAVEGLQTLVGEVDEFGEIRSRRSRVAQLLRAAAEKCHVVFVVEEADDKIRLPEDYVADVVLRLRSAEHSHGGRSYLRRTVEIEKARAQAHVRGQHALVIRDGSGSWTGAQYNPDDPPVVVEFNGGKPIRIKWKPDVQRKGDDTAEGSSDRSEPFQRVAYVNVVPSLDFVSRREQSDVDAPKPKSGDRVRFGIRHLDDMLTRPKPDGPISSRGNEGNGLAFGSLTAIIGENGTHRNRVANAFLSQSFVGTGADKNVAILITTDNTDAGELKEKLALHMPGQREKRAQQHVICRRLEVHDLTAAALFHVIDCAIRFAKTTAGTGGLIRMVISNLELMHATYPEVIDDPLFLPALKLRILQAGVTTIVVHTDPAGPDRSRQNALSQVLRSDLAAHIIYTWNVAFFGEERVAIMLPTTGFSDSRRPVVRELRGSQDRELVVDPHFELYSGLLERREVEMIPLQVRLWGHSEQFQSYVQDVRALMGGVFRKDDRSEHIVDTGTEIRYEDIRSASNFRGGIGLNSTAILQVDEFWHVHHNELQRMEDYLFGLTVQDGQAVLQTDPYKVFQFTGSKHSTKALTSRRKLNLKALKEAKQKIDAKPKTGKGKAREDDQKILDRHDRLAGLPSGKLAESAAQRSEFFVTQGYSYNDAVRTDDIDRVPYFWDFGFIVLRQRLWEEASKKQFRSPGKDDLTSVGEVYEKLIARSTEQKLKPKPVSWREFLNACTVVARTAGLQRDGVVPPFLDLDMMAAESLCCFVLEVLASTIREMDGKSITDGAFATDRGMPGKPGLVDILVKHRAAFYKSWLLIGETLSASQLGIEWYLPEVRRANRKAVASRHWYASACAIEPGSSLDDPLLPVRMPGNFSVRGDWFLAIASGSRSRLLGERAIDILSTRKANLERLKRGIGLPTRDCGLEGGKGSSLDETRTRLMVRKEHRLEPMHYQDVKRLGATGDPMQDEFNWLWRYTIKDYDRQAPVFAQMTAYMLKRCPTYWDALVSGGEKYRGAFEAYDNLTADQAGKGAESEDFKGDCELWCQRLRDSSIPATPDHQTP